MSNQAFYDEYIREYARRSRNEKYTYQKTLITVSETKDGKNWAYLSTTYLNELEARHEARKMSKWSNTLWRVAIGNHTIALYLNGEEVKENG